MHDSLAEFYGLGPAAECFVVAGAIRRGVIACTAYHSVRARRRGEAVLSISCAGTLARERRLRKRMPPLVSFGLRARAPHGAARPTATSPTAPVGRSAGCAATTRGPDIGGSEGRTPRGRIRLLATVPGRCRGVPTWRCAGTWRGAQNEGEDDSPRQDSPRVTPLVSRAMHRHRRSACIAALVCEDVAGSEQRAWRCCRHSTVQQRIGASLHNVASAGVQEQLQRAFRRHATRFAPSLLRARPATSKITRSPCRGRLVVSTASLEGIQSRALTNLGVFASRGCFDLGSESRSSACQDPHLVSRSGFAIFGVCLGVCSRRCL